MGVATRASLSGAAPDGAIKRVPLFRVSTQESLDSPIDRRSAYYREQALELLQRKGALKPQRMMTPPNLLTFLRVLLVPVLVVTWYGDHRHYNVATAAIFIAASITDWLDGCAALRRYGPARLPAPAPPRASAHTTCALQVPGPPHGPHLCIWRLP